MWYKIITLLFVMVIFSLIFLGAGFFLSRKIQVHPNEKQDGMFSFFRYSILFITIVMMIGGGIGVFMSVADYAAPNTYNQSYEEYKVYQGEENIEGKKESSENQMKKMYEEQMKLEEQRMKEFALQGIIKSFGFIVIPFPFFYFFAKKKKG